MKRTKTRAAALLAAAMLTISCAPTVSAGVWLGEAGMSPYYRSDNTFATGITIIDSVAYSFGSDGACLGRYTGFGRQQGQLRYYANGSAYKSGWLSLESGTYYFYPDGSAATGTVNIGGSSYSFAPDGRLITAQSISGYTLTASKSSVYAGRNDSIDFTVSANGSVSSAIVRDDIVLHRYVSGVWTTVEQNVLTHGLSSDPFGSIHVIGGTGADRSHTISFRPDSYSDSLTSGKYRAVVTLMTESGSIITKTCEFQIIQPVAVSTASSVYYINSTDKIYFSTALNVGAEVYGPEIYELYFFDEKSSRWIRTEPKEGEDIIADTHYAPAGSVVSSYIDLTRYSRSSMSSGRYRVILGDNINCDFELKKPFEVSVQQVSTAKKTNKQVKITISNDSARSITVSGYGELYRYNGKSWKKLSLKKGKKLDTKMEIPSMYKWTKTMLLNDYYSSSSLKSGSYCMKFPSETGGFVYAYFTIS